MAEQRLIALGDILGFKDTILNTPLDRILDQHFGYFRKALQHSLLNLQGKTDVPDDIEALKQAAGLGLEWFSDTIILYTNDDTEHAELALIQTVTWLLFETMCYAPVRLRFGIDYGELYVSKNAGQIVGRGLIGAYELERTQCWAGGALTPAAAQHLRPSARDYLADYTVPVKEQRLATNVAVNWTLGIHLGFAVQFSRTKPKPTAADRLNRADIIEKWEHTIAFHNAVCEGCRTRRPTATQQ